MPARLNEDVLAMNTNYNIIHADFVKWLRGNQWLMQNGHMEKYHAVLADPPYFLDSINKRFGKPGSVEAQYGRDGSFQRLGKGFMGKQWDGFDSVWEYQAWVTEWATMLLDFVHPGGVLLMFGGTRTYHRLVAGLEDAGWEIYDSIMVWTYGSGFPKSHDISKGIDRAAGMEREVIGANKTSRLGHNRNLNDDNWQQIGTQVTPITAPATPEAAQWEGMGTALAPSHEPIVLARKPRGGLTYAECALQFGSGALNIDGSRIGMSSNDHDDYMNKRESFRGVTGMQRARGVAMNEYSPQLSPEQFTAKSHLGRWPKNTILIHHPDCSDNECVEACHVRVLGEMSGDSVSTGGTNPFVNKAAIFGEETNRKPFNFGDACNASRFFYQAKSPNWERDAGLDNPPEFSPTMGNGIGAREHDPSDTNAYRRNSHPTLKPIQLTEYLAKLLLPPIDNSRLLVPFAGSGSEMIGAMLAGWQHITGIEMTDEYIPIAKARLKWWAGFDSYEAAKLSATSIQRGQATEEKKAASGQMSLFDLL